MTIAVDMGRKATKTNKQNKWVKNIVFIILKENVMMLVCQDISQFNQMSVMVAMVANSRKTYFNEISAYMQDVSKPGIREYVLQSFDEEEKEGPRALGRSPENDCL